jgi:hypothetical protein
MPLTEILLYSSFDSFNSCVCYWLEHKIYALRERWILKFNEISLSFFSLIVKQMLNFKIQRDLVVVRFTNSETNLEF